MLKEADITGYKGVSPAMKSDKTWEPVQKQGIINETRHEYNAEIFTGLLNASGISNKTLIDGLRSGNISPAEAKKALRDALANKTAWEKKEAYNALNETAKKSRIFMRSVQDKVKNNASDRAEARIRKRIDNAGSLNITEAAREHLRNQTRMQERINRTVEHIDYVTGKKTGKLEDLGDKLTGISKQKTERIETQLNESNITDAEKEKLLERIKTQENKTERIQERITERINKNRRKGGRVKE